MRDGAPEAAGTAGDQGDLGCETAGCRHAGEAAEERRACGVGAGGGTLHEQAGSKYNAYKSAGQEEDLRLEESSQQVNVHYKRGILGETAK